MRRAAPCYYYLTKPYLLPHYHLTTSTLPYDYDYYYDYYYYHYDYYHYYYYHCYYYLSAMQACGALPCAAELLRAKVKL